MAGMTLGWAAYRRSHSEVMISSGGSAVLLSGSPKTTLPQHATRVDQHLLLQPGRLEPPEGAVVDGQEHDVGPLDRLLERHQRELVEAPDVRLADQELAQVLLAQPPHDAERRRLAQVVDVGLEGEPKAGDRRPAEAGRLRPDPLDDPSGLASFTSRAVRISRASSAAWETMNHGSTAMQCPPTPRPGRRTPTWGWRLASSISSKTSTPTRSQTIDSSLASAMLTSR
jgi:hypothetical protein